MAQPTPDKQLVEAGYDKIAQAHHEWTKDKQPHRLRYTNDLIDHLPAHATVLELGCGAGVPVLEKLSHHASQIVANDISAAQIELAKTVCPHADFRHGDMHALEFAPNSLDGVAAFFSIFHLPRTEQPAMLSRVFSWMKSGSHFAFNLAAYDREEIRGNFHGAEMFWSGFSLETSKTMIQTAGFEIVQSEVLGTGEETAPDDPDHGIEFLWILARKP